MVAGVVDRDAGENVSSCPQKTATCVVICVIQFLCLLTTLFIDWQRCTPSICAAAAAWQQKE